MALEDRDIFNAIFERYADQPIEFVMLQYEKARRMNMEIERRPAPAFECEVAPVAEIETEADTVVEEQAPRKKRYTKRSLRVSPEQAITENAIFCCICGEERQSLTAKHLANHGISVEDYKKLCGYPADQVLMSGRRLAKSKEIIARAQRARLDKKAATSDD